MILSLRVASHRALVAAVLVATSVASQAQTVRLYRGQTNIVSSGGSGAAYLTGIDLNAFVGAAAFYGAGYTGSRSTVANIEGGLAARNHVMTAKIGQVFSGAGASTTAFQLHPTECASMAAGYDPANPGAAYSRGLAYGANLWTGNVGLTFNGGSFTTTTNSVFTAYYNALIGGVGGSTANIVTSSWGATDGNVDIQRGIAAGAPIFTAGGTTYSNFDPVSIDAIVAASNKLVVFAAGNNGGGAGDLHTVGSPASGNNAFVVGASGPNNVGNPSAAYASRASFSAYGSSTAFAPTDPQRGAIIDSATARRARVDILAPGVQIVGASNAGPNLYNGGNGTSFATPIVAGGAALVQDAAQALGYTSAVDNRVTIAILQNSANKLIGWTNGSTVVGGVQTTSQALDYGQGAGQMNLTRAYEQLTAGTHDVAGTGGGSVLAKGWDLGALGVGATNTYTMSLLGGTTFTSTLRFNGGATFGTLGAGNAVSESQLGYSYLSNFSLQLYRLGVSAPILVAESNARYITTEHFQFALTTTGQYQLRVNYLADNYNFVGDHGAVGYGLAWSGTQAVPEPASLAALGLGALAMLRRRRKA